MEGYGTPAQRFRSFLEPPSHSGGYVKNALRRRQRCKEGVRRQQHAARKSGQQQKWGKPPEHAMREERKRQKTVTRIEVFGMSKKGLIVAGADAYPPRKLRCPRWSYLFNRNCCRIINYPMSLEANLERNLEVL